MNLPPETITAAPSSMLALATTVHVALLMLRRYRGVHTLGQAGVLLPSLGLTAMPWLFPDPRWIAAGLGVHLVWFVACEKLLPKPTPAAAARPVAPAARPQPSPVQKAAVPAVGFEPLPVLAVFEESEDIKTFRVRRPEGFHFTAGQFLTVKVQVDGKPMVRCYSISSAPEAAGYLEISVKRQGVVSGTLHATVRPGSMLTAKGPTGKFTFPAGDDRPVVFLAGGVGAAARGGRAGSPGRAARFMARRKPRRGREKPRDDQARRGGQHAPRSRSRAWAPPASPGALQGGPSTAAMLSRWGRAMTAGSVATTDLRA